MISAKKSAKTFFWTFTGSALGFASQLVVARLLGPEGYGQANVILGMAGTISLFLNFGFSTLILREIPRLERKLVQPFFSFFLVLVYTIDICALVALFTPLRSYLLSTGLRVDDFWYVLLLVILNHSAALVYSYLVGLRKQPIASFFRNFLPAVLKFPVFLTALIASFDFDYRRFLTVTLISLIPTLSVALLNLRKPIFVRGFLKDALQFYTISILYASFLNLSKILQSVFGGVAYTGYLSLGITLGNAGVMIGTVLATMAMPDFSYYWSKGNTEKIRQIFQQATRWSAYSTLPIALFFWIHVDDVLRLLGKGYEKGDFIVLMILGAQFFNAFVGPNGTLLSMSGYQKYEIINGAAMLTVSALLSMLLGPRFPWGIALALASGIILVNVMKTIEVGIIHRVWPYERRTLIYIASIGILEFSILEILKIPFHSEIVSLVIGSLAVASFMVISFYFSPVESDKKLIRRFFGRILML